MVPFERLPQLIITETKENSTMQFTYQIETFSFKGPSYSASMFVCETLNEVLQGLLLGSNLVSDMSLTVDRYENFHLLKVNVSPTMLGLENGNLIIARLLKGISQLASLNTHQQYLKLRNALEIKFLTMERMASYDLTRILSQAPSVSTDSVVKYMKTKYCLADYDPVSINKVIEKLNANNLLIHIGGWFEIHSSASTTEASPDFNLQDALSKRLTNSEWKRQEKRPEAEWRGSLQLTRKDPSSNLFYHVQNIDEGFWAFVSALSKQIPVVVEAERKMPAVLNWLLLDREAVEAEYRLSGGLDADVESFEPVAAGDRVYYRKNSLYGSPVVIATLRLRFDSFAVGSITEHSNMLLREKIWQRRISPIKRVLETLNGHVSINYSERSLLLTIGARSAMMSLVIDQLLQSLDFIANSQTKDEFHQALESLFAGARKTAFSDLHSTMIDFKRKLAAGEYSLLQTVAEISSKQFALQEERKNPYIIFGLVEGPVDLLTAVSYLEKIQQTYPM